MKAIPLIKRPGAVLALALAAGLTGSGAAGAAVFDVYDGAEFSRIASASNAPVTLATGLGWVEGPVWVPAAGHLVFSDMTGNRLCRWSPVTGFTPWIESASRLLYNGNALDLEGRLISCQAGPDGRKVVRLEPDGSASTLLGEYGGRLFNSPNDVTVAADGWIWFTDPDYDSGQNSQPGRYVYCFDPADPAGSVRAAATDLVRPNGLCFSPNGDRLYVVDSDSTRQVIQVYDVQPDHTLTNSRAFCQVASPDGVRCDVEGRLWASSAEGVRVYGAGGHWIATLLLPNLAANLCFGDADWQTLYVVARPGLYAMRLNVAGAAALRRWPSVPPFAMNPAWSAGGHGRDVAAVAWEPGGAQAVTAGGDATVKVWRTADDALLASLSTHPAPATCVAPGPGGGILAAGDDEGRISLWQPADVPAGFQLVRRSTVHLGRVGALAWSPDGQWLASTGVEGSNVVERLDDGRVLAQFGTYSGAPANAAALAVSSNGFLATGCDDGTVRAWSAATWRLVWNGSAAHASNVTAVAFAPDGSHLASAGLDRCILVRETSRWDAVQLRLEGAHAAGVTALAFSPDGTRLASGDAAGEVKLRDARSGETLAVRMFEGGSVCALAFHPEGTSLHVGSRAGLRQTWNFNDSPAGHGRPGHAGSILATALSPDGRHVASLGSDRVVQVRRVADGAPVESWAAHTDWGSDVVFAGENLLVTAGGPFDASVKVWQFAPRALLRQFQVHTNGVTALACSRDAGLIAAAGDATEGRIALVDLVSGAVVRVLEGHPQGVTTLAFSSDGSRLASGGRRPSAVVKVWDVAQGTLLQSFGPHRGNVESLAFLPRNTAVVSGCAGDGWIRLWNLADGSLRVFGQEEGSVDWLACSGDGALLAAGGAEGSVELWNMAGGRLAKVFNRGAARVTRGAYHGANDQLLLGREDGTVELVTRTPVELPFEVTLANPGTSLVGGQPLALMANATTPGNNLARVEFFLDGTAIGQAVNPLYDTVYTLTVPLAPAGYHTLRAKATDLQGHTTWSEPILASVAWPVRTLLPAGATWKYHDGAMDLGTAWRQPDYDDLAWASGPAMLGFGDANGRAPDTDLANNRQWTTYFRSSFEVADPASFTNLVVSLLRDDAAVVYLNGDEIWRHNLPDTGEILYSTPAEESVGGADENRWWTTNIPPVNLVAGRNVLAVEIHQYETGSSDVLFDFECEAQSALTRPRLTLLCTEARTEVAWPDWAGGLQLYSTGDLLPPVLWQPEPAPPLLEDGRCLLIVPQATEGVRFFRLGEPLPGP